MCLILVAWQVDPNFPLVVAANRDEFYARPTASLGYWADAPHVIGGRDLESGGTWLGVSTSGRFAAVTNVREPGGKEGKSSRGTLTCTFLASTHSADLFAAQIEGERYSGFNLLLGDDKGLIYCSNRNGQPRRLTPGVYGLSNHRLDTPWPKLLTAKERFVSALSRLPDDESFFDLLTDDSVVPDDALPHTGVPIEWERLLSAVFIKSEHYGTRASSVLWRTSRGGMQFCEKSFGPFGDPVQSSVISISV